MDKNKIFRFSLAQIIGTLIYTLGVAGLVVAGHGAGPIDASAYFSSVLFGLTPGAWIIIINSLLVITLLIAKKKLKVLLNFLMLVASGYLIDFWIFIFEKLFNFSLVGNELIQGTTIALNNGFLMGLLVAVIGFIAIGVGVAILILNNVILSPLDEFTVFIASFTKKYFHAKVLIDASFLTLALVLGLILGMAEVKKQINFFSIIIVFGLGPFINLILDYFNKKGEIENGTK